MSSDARPSCPVCGSSDTAQFVEASGGEADWQVWRCRQCGHGRTLPGLDEREIVALYPSDYLGNPTDYLERLADGRLEGSRSLKRLRSKIELIEKYCPGGRILDVGCGGCSFLAALESDRWEKTGVEPIAATVEAVRPLLPQTQLFVGTLLSTDLPASQFNCITFWHVFEHVEDPRAVLESAARLLAPGGIVFINLPHFDSYQARLFGRHWYGLDAPRHRHHFSAESLGRLLSQLGLEPKRVTPRHEVLHTLKQSLLHWSEARFSSRLPYYILKPGLFPFRWWEQRTPHAGDLAMVGRKN